MSLRTWWHQRKAKNSMTEDQAQEALYQFIYQKIDDPTLPASKDTMVYQVFQGQLLKPIKYMIGINSSYSPVIVSNIKRTVLILGPYTSLLDENANVIFTLDEPVQLVTQNYIYYLDYFQSVLKMAEKKKH